VDARPVLPQSIDLWRGNDPQPADVCLSASCSMSTKRCALLVAYRIRLDVCREGRLRVLPKQQLWLQVVDAKARRTPMVGRRRVLDWPVSAPMRGRMSGSVTERWNRAEDIQYICMSSLAWLARVGGLAPLTCMRVGERGRGGRAIARCRRCRTDDVWDKIDLIPEHSQGELSRPTLSFCRLVSIG
jgi:hypothetical protein